MSRLKAVLFDIDDTLYSTTAFARSARRNAVRAMVQCGIRLPEEEVANELDEVIREFGSNFEHHYDKLLMRLAHESWAGANPALIVAAGVVAYHDTKFQELHPFPDVRPLLSGLRGAGLRTGIITHGLTVKQAEKLVRLRILPYLDPGAIFISDQVGISKPNPKLYALALRSMKLSAADVMYVGDNLLHDIEPPKSLGMVSVWTRRAAKPGQDSANIVPEHAIEDFRQLAAILREKYAVPLVEF